VLWFFWRLVVCRLSDPVSVALTRRRHDDRTHRQFAEAVRGMPEVICADSVTGETDALLIIVAREIAELQRVLVHLSTCGGVWTRSRAANSRRYTACPTLTDAAQ
jgi:DNA-binding Lrp family transcriptional regulator